MSAWNATIPDGLTRDRPIIPGRVALLVIDAQNGTSGAAAGMERTVANIARLLAAFRAARLEVIFTVIENLTADGRDRSLDYKLSGLSVAKGSWEARMLPGLEPAGDEVVLPKTSSSVFNSTILGYLLRNIGIEDVFVAGFLTDQCIDHAIKDGADRGFYMTCIHDACAAETAERHAVALACFRGYCRMLATEDAVKLAVTGS